MALERRLKVRSIMSIDEGKDTIKIQPRQHHFQIAHHIATLCQNLEKWVFTENSYTLADCSLGSLVSLLSLVTQDTSLSLRLRLRLSPSPSLSLSLSLSLSHSSSLPLSRLSHFSLKFWLWHYSSPRENLGTASAASDTDTANPARRGGGGGESTTP